MAYVQIDNSVITAVTGTKAAGTAAASALLTGGVYNSGGITLTTTQQSALQLTSAGRLMIDTGTVAVTGTFWQATQPVSGTFWQATQPVSGTVAATQSGTWNIGTVTTLPALVAGSAIIGKVGIDQTTPGTTNLVALAANQSVNVAQINGVTTLMGNGVTGTGSQRVTIASDNTAFTVNAAQSGTWNITNVSGTVSLPTGAATSAAQTTIATNQTNVTGTKAAGTAAANSVLTGGVYNSGGITLTTTQQASLQLDASGNLKVTGGGGGTQFAEDAAHTTADLGTMALGVRLDTPSATSGTSGDYQPMIFDSLGRQYVVNPLDIASGVSPVTGNITASGNSSAFTPTANRPFLITVSGTFVATWFLEKSFDSGSTWFPDRDDGGATIVYNTFMDKQFICPRTSTQYRLNATGTWTSGTVAYRFDQ